MTADQLLNAYPHCRVAISWVELVLCGRNNPAERSAWEELTKHMETPDEIMPILREVLDSEIEEGQAGNLVEARAEIEHPSFLTYLAGKLGEM